MRKKTRNQAISQNPIFPGFSIKAKEIQVGIQFFES